MNSFELYSKLKKIPFLKIGQVDYLDDLKLLLPQLRNRPVAPFRYDDSQSPTICSLGVNVESIYDSADIDLGSISSTILKSSPWKKCIPKTLANEFPLLKKAVDEYIDVPGRCRLSVLPAGEHVQWHCHGYLHTLPLLTEVVLHMPIQSINVSARVADSNYNKVYNSKFNEGELWFLNTWLPHSFDNQGPLDRYHLWMNTYLTNEAGESVNLKLNSLLEDAVAKYEGPLLT